MAETKRAHGWGDGLYELAGPMRETRRAHGWTQVEFAERAGIARPNVSIIENGLRRIGEDKARRICATLGVELDQMFRRVLPATAACRMFGLKRPTLVAAALDKRSHIIPHAVEHTARSVVVYFIEDDLRRQLAALPLCRENKCKESALARSGYCTGHKTMASRARMIEATARPASERLWLTEDEAAADVGRAWETVNRAINCGDLRAFRIRGRVLVPKRDLSEWAKTLPIKYGMQRPTRLELGLRRLLDELGVEFEEQFSIGNYTVDAFVPKIGLVVEADGWYWHTSEAKEATRDAYLMRNPLVRAVVHLTAEQLAPWTPKDWHSTAYRAAILAA